MCRRDVTGVECTLKPEYATAEWIDRLILRAATFDELLSDDFESLPGQKTDSDLATRRLAAWCRNAASGDWALFVRRLDRDGLSLIDVLKRFSTARRRASVARPDWVGDALWLAAALEREPRAASGRPGQCAFEDLLIPAVDEAETLLWSSLGARVRGSVAEAACDGLRRGLLSGFSDLCAPALYKKFCKTKLAERAEAGETSQYVAFVDGMRTGGFGQLFDEKPVLLRLMAVVARQWLDATTEMMTRLDRDKGLLEGELLGGNAAGRVLRIEGDLSDPHNGGRTVKVLTFESGARVVYKPKDLRLDLAWHRLITRLDESDPPIDLRTVRTSSATATAGPSGSITWGAAISTASDASSGGPEPGSHCSTLSLPPICTTKTSSLSAISRYRSTWRWSCRPARAEQCENPGRPGLPGRVGGAGKLGIDGGLVAQLHADS